MEMWDIDVNSVLDIPSAAKLPTVISLIIWLVSCCWGGGIQKKMLLEWSKGFAW
jgi:hypothetical protein